MKKVIVLFFIVAFCSCKQKESNVNSTFEINYQDFSSIRRIMHENFDKIRVSDSCYKQEKLVHFTLKYLENCFSSLDKNIFDKIHSFISEYSIHSMLLEEEKLTFLIKINSNIFNTEKQFIIFSNSKVSVKKGGNIKSSNVEKLKEDWYLLTEIETTF